MSKISGINSAIHEKFDNESACAEALGWKRQRLNKITNGNKEPNISELNALAIVLGRSVGEVAGFFISSQSPNG